jgi:protein phosphatase
MGLKINAYADKDPGKVYEINEDSVFAYIRPENLGKALGLLVVADGIGGHLAGEVASKIVTDTIYETLKPFLETDSSNGTQPITEDTESQNDPNSNPYLEGKLQMAVEAANTAVYNYAKQHPKEAGNLGSTLTCMLIEGNQAVIANVGDSRTYHLRKTKFTRVTKDHSYVETLIEKGMVDEDAYYTHPHRSVITRALGNEEEVEIDFFVKKLRAGDRFLLCSDGCWEYIANEEKIKDILKDTKDIKETVKLLIEAANNGGGGDNIGVVVAEFKK